MLEKLKDIGLMIYKAGDNMVNHDGVEHAGYLSFITLLALFPFLVFFVAILGALGETQSGDDFIHMILDNAPKHLLEALLPRIDEILSGPPQGLLTISIVGTIWTSSSIVEGLRTVLNKAYHVHTPPNYYFRRAVSIAQILLLTLILVITMLLLVLFPILFNKIYGLIFSFSAVSGSGQELPRFTFFAGEWEFIRFLFAYVVLLLFISMLYYVLPNVKQSLVRTLPGALISLLGWVLAAKALTYYFTNFSQLNLVYGSLGGIIAFLLFFYIINIIFIYGAEFNYLLEKYLGHKIEQKQEVKPEQIKSGEEKNRIVTEGEIVVPHDGKK